MEIKVSNLEKNYGRIRALADLTFTLSPGKVTGLVGPNGAGKSTLLRLMAGREYPDRGDVTYDGLSAVDYPERLAGIVGLMPDTLPSAVNWRIGDYLDYYARANGLKGEERRKRVNEIKIFTYLTELDDRPLSTLSKGMKQRVSLARLLLASPQILLLDEPAAGLDPRARIELREIIRQLADQGKTILLSSHILTELEDMCDDLMILEKGELVTHNSIAAMELENKPENSTVSIMLEFPELTPELMEKLKNIATEGTVITATGRRTVSVEISRETADDFMASIFTAHLPLASFCYRGRTLETLFMDSTKGRVQ